MKFKSRFSNTFLLCLILGLATHMYRLTNWMLCEDSLAYLDSISPSWVISIGRYFLPVVEKIRGEYELSWLLGLLSIIFMSMAAGIIAETFKVDGTIKRLLIAWIVVANPVVTSTFAYMYTADGYFFGFMLATLFVYLIDRGEKKLYTVLGVMALVVSMGFYQGFLTAAVVLILFRLILMLLDEKYTVKDVFKKGLKYLICGAVAMIIYTIGMNVAWKLTHHQLTGYMGIGEKPETGLIRYWYAFKECYVDFARVMLVRWKITFYNVSSVLMLLAAAISFFVIVTKKKFWKQPARWIAVVVIVVLLPVATHAFEFLSENVSYTTTIMDYGTMMVFLLPVLLFNRLDIGEGIFKEFTDKTYVKKHIMWCANVVLMLLICFNFTVIANKAYYSMFMANKNCELLINRVEMRIEALEGYDSNGQIMICGSQYQIPEYVSNAPMMSGVVSNIFITAENGYKNYMNKMLSTSYGNPSYDKEKEIALTDEFMSMTKWPSAESVKMIDGVMVVMLSYQNVDELYDDVADYQRFMEGKKK